MVVNGENTNNVLIPLELCHESHAHFCIWKIVFQVNKLKYHLVLCWTTQWTSPSHSTQVTNANVAANSAQRTKMKIIIRVLRLTTAVMWKELLIYRSSSTRFKLQVLLSDEQDISSYSGDMLPPCGGSMNSTGDQFLLIAPLSYYKHCVQYL